MKPNKTQKRDDVSQYHHHHHRLSGSLYLGTIAEDVRGNNEACMGKLIRYRTLAHTYYHKPFLELQCNM